MWFYFPTTLQIACSTSYTLGFSKCPAFHCSRLFSVRMSLLRPIISLAELLQLREEKKKYVFSQVYSVLQLGLNDEC